MKAASVASPHACMAPGSFVLGKEPLLGAEATPLTALGFCSGL